MDRKGRSFALAALAAILTTICVPPASAASFASRGAPVVAADDGLCVGADPPRVQAENCGPLVHIVVIIQTSGGTQVFEYGTCPDNGCLVEIVVKICAAVEFSEQLAEAATKAWGMVEVEGNARPSGPASPPLASGPGRHVDGSCPFDEDGHLDKNAPWEIAGVTTSRNA